MVLSSSEIKSALKEAREALRQKKQDNAIQILNGVLKDEPDHHMALILIGAAYQETHPDRAAKCLRRAIELPDNKSNPAVALQGLSMCAEPKEMPDICAKLLQLVPDRYEDFYGRLLKAANEIRQMITDVEPFVDVFAAELNTVGLPDERRDCARFYAAKLFLVNPGCAASPQWQPMFRDAMRHTCEHPRPESQEQFNGAVLHTVMYKSYLKMLFAAGVDEHRTLLECSDRMHSLYPDETYPLECICNVFAKHDESGDGFRADDFLTQPMADYAGALLDLYPRSTDGLLALAIIRYGESNFVEARSLLLRLYGIRWDWYLCFSWLARTHFNLGAWAIAEALLLKNNERDLMLLECLIAQPEYPEKIAQALTIGKELLQANANCLRTHFALAKAYIHSENFDEVIQSLATLTGFGAKNLATIVEAMFAMKQENPAKAIDVLTTLMDDDSCEHLLLLGQAYLRQAETALALGAFMSATKLEPQNSECFYWLAECYLANGPSGHNRAVKCLEKCLLLNERHRAATQLFVFIQSEAQAFDAIDAKLSVTVKDPVPNVLVPCPWVWLMLGTNRSRAGRYNDAVSAFRVAIRENPGDINCWLGMADTYRERGSYMSALKVYQKCLELREASGSADDVTGGDLEEYRYARLQVASLKISMGAYDEAIEAFRALLDEYADFVPALKGLADALLAQAEHLRDEKRFGRAKEHAAEAVRAATQALRLRNDFAALWRLLASAVAFVARLAPDRAWLEVPGELVQRTVAAEGAAAVRLDGAELLALAQSCLNRALKIRPDDVLLWYDVALNYFQRALDAESGSDERLRLLERAQSAARYTIQLQSGRWQNWNLLGLVCAMPEIDNAPLAQHAFIRAVQLNRTAAPAWTNLGVLYATQSGDVRLANRAFGQAQQAQPDYVHGWTGQACLAERIGQSAEAIDLFQHATHLQYSGESALGFVHWICMVLNDLQNAERSPTVDRHMRYICERMFGATEALDSIELYLRAESTVTAATWCFAGYLYYGRSLWPQAVRAFGQAVELCPADAAMRDRMLFNWGLSLVRAGEFERAQAVYHAVTEATFETAIGLAVAHQLAGQFEEAYGAFESALQLLAQTDAQRSQILVAMSAIVYKFQGEPDAKSLLFQCIGLPNPPVEGLFSGCAVGIIHDDMQLSELVLAELHKYQHDTRYIHHIAFLTAQFHLKHNRTKKALMYLLSQVHMHPEHVELRKVLANFIMQNAQKQQSLMLAASRVAESTIVLQLNAPASSNDTSMQGARSLAMASEAMRCVDQYRRRMLAQRAVHTNPTCREAWAALLMCN